MAVVQWIVNLGSTVMMPIIFLVVGLIFRMKFWDAFKAGMLVGVGFTGVNLVINLMLNALGPASKAMVRRFGLHLTATDIGWGSASTIAWSSPIMFTTVIGFLLINAIMLVLKLTKTVDLDIFNFWLFLIVGAVIYATTKNFWIAVILTWIIYALCLVVGDLTQPTVQKQFPQKNLSGIAFPHLTCLAWAPFGIIANWICERIPGIRKINWDPEAIHKKLGTLGEPIIFGFIIGALLGILAGYNVSDFLKLGVNISAAMYLLPVVVNVLVSGLTMVKNHVIKKLKVWFPKRTFYIGMDTALLIDDPAVLTTGLLLIPLILILALILPGNRVLPFVDLASLSFLFALVAPFCKRNIFRMLVAGVLIGIVALYCGTATSSAFRVAGHMARIAAVDKFTAVTALVSPVTTWVGWLFIQIGKWIAAII